MFGRVAAEVLMFVFMFANEQRPQVRAFYRKRDVSTSYVIIRLSNIIIRPGTTLKSLTRL